MHLLRSLLAVPLAVYITVGADAIAMMRHPDAWMRSAARDELIAVLGGVLLVAIAMHVLISRDAPARGASSDWRKAAIAVVLVAATLAVYPEHLIGGLVTHLLTVVVGSAMLFAPMRPLLLALVPSPERDTEQRGARTPSSWFRRARPWLGAALTGAAFGTFAFLGELSEGPGTLPVARLLIVASVFLGLAIVGLLLAYLCLGVPLGLGPQART